MTEREIIKRAADNTSPATCPTCQTIHTRHPATGPYCSPLCLSQAATAAAPPPPRRRAPRARKTPA